ncbi:hypothetical protein [Phytoactinopolyspora halophila]|uniref:hypothetical protein n=1 Tax=Phytoactinopolyspora halophila TaxID=1981511 RepID=UPI0013147552|nr:hypothetical protein [Phytoactinopolyspora halophila]
MNAERHRRHLRVTRATATTGDHHRGLGGGPPIEYAAVRTTRLSRRVKDGVSTTMKRF